MEKQNKGERCRNCGHLRKFHHLEGTGSPIRYMDRCKFNTGSFKFQRCSCECFELKQEARHSSQA
jgi:hypothetical protein